MQGILWSVDVNQLDSERDNGYIINQILSLGSVKDLKWLFQTYPQSEIAEIFIKKPSKSYRPSAFNFCKNILLGLENIHISPDKYVNTTPRNIRS